MQTHIYKGVYRYTHTGHHLLSVASSLVLRAFHWPHLWSVPHRQPEGNLSKLRPCYSSAQTLRGSLTHTGEAHLRQGHRSLLGQAPFPTLPPIHSAAATPASSLLPAPCNTAGHGACVLLECASPDVLLVSSVTVPVPLLLGHLFTDASHPHLLQPPL